MTLIPLDLVDLALAATLILLNAALSIWLRLGLARQILIAALRMGIQLWLLGLVLAYLFELTSPALTGAAALVMIGFAGFEVFSRQSRPIRGLWTYGLGTGTMLLAGGLVTVFALTALVAPAPWYDPRFALPLLGMVLGNTMTGIALGLDSLSGLAVRERAAIEARLCLGATRAAALRPVLRDAARTGMIPIVNSMAATGLVAIPGMMTGQILAGAAPMEAIKYQLLIMCLIAGGTSLGVFLSVVGMAAFLSDSRHRLRLDRLRPAKPAPDSPG